MIRKAIILIICILSLQTVHADPTILKTSVENAKSAVERNAFDQTISEIYNGDVYMPTLAEMLGEPVDNLGHITGNEWLKDQLVSYAKSYLGCRYRRGGKGPSAFDCSGFTSFVFRNFGYDLSPASSAQSLQGEHVDLHSAEVGDLMFFSGSRGGKRVGHVGMIIDVDRAKGTVKFIHASSSAGIEIQNFPDNGYYSKRFLSVRRVLNDADDDLASANL